MSGKETQIIFSRTPQLRNRLTNDRNSGRKTSIPRQIDEIIGKSMVLVSKLYILKLFGTKFTEESEPIILYRGNTVQCCKMEQNRLL